jgi:hypothetical protein
MKEFSLAHIRGPACNIRTERFTMIFVMTNVIDFVASHKTYLCHPMLCRLAPSIEIHPPRLA